MLTCAKCENQLETTWRFCRYCGVEIPKIIKFDDLLSLGLRKWAGLLDPAITNRDIPLVVMVDLNETTISADSTVEVSSDHLPLIKRKGSSWARLSSGERLAESNESDYLAVIDTTTRILELTVRNLVSNDLIPITITSSMHIELHSANDLCEYLEKEPRIFTTFDVSNLLWANLQFAAQSFFENKSIGDVFNDSLLATESRQALQQSIADGLKTFGMVLSGHPEFDVYIAGWSTESDETEEFCISSTRTDWQQTATTLDSISFSAILALVEETNLSMPFRKVAFALEGIRINVLAGRCSLLHGNEAFLGLLAPFTKGGWLTSNRVETIVDAVEEAHNGMSEIDVLLLRRLELEIEYEQSLVSIIHRYGLSDERIALEDQQARTNVESKWEFERQTVTLDVYSKDGSLATNARDGTHAEEIYKSTENNSLAWHGLDLYARYRQIKREDQAAQIHSHIEVEHRQNILNFEREAAALELRLREQAVEHQRRLEEIEALSNIGIETLIAISGPEQSNLLLQLSKTRALKGFSPEKILALQGIESPLLSDAIREIGTALSIQGSGIGLLGSSAEVQGAGVSASIQEIEALNRDISSALESVSENPALRGVLNRNTSSTIERLGSNLSNHETVTILFSDIKGSTEITSRLGDIAAQELFNRHNKIVRTQVAEFQGQEIKSMGDGFMLAFPSALNGILCAIQIQRMCSQHNQANPEEQILVRIGLHAGEAIKEGQDYFGRNVILASRISAQANENQILVSSILKEMTDSFKQLEFDSPISMVLKGLPGNVLIYPVHW